MVKRIDYIQQLNAFGLARFLIYTFSPHVKSLHPEAKAEIVKAAKNWLQENIDPSSDKMHDSF